LTSTRHSLADAALQLQKMEEQISQFRRVGSQLAEEISGKQRLLVQNHSDIDDLRSRLTDLKASLQMLREENTHLAKLLSEKSDACAHLGATFMEHQQALVDENQDLSSTLNEKTDTLREVRMRLSSLEARLSSMQSESLKRRDELERTRATLSSTHADFHGAQTAMESLQQQYHAKAVGEQRDGQATVIVAVVFLGFVGFVVWWILSLLQPAL